MSKVNYMATIKVNGTLEIGNVIINEDWNISESESKLNIEYKNENIASIKAHETDLNNTNKMIARDEPDRTTSKKHLMYK
uniref:Uncharacterized protein n=1 Tax=viral metagenome TaxID=1070528 RepID=A0A6C0F831_9ZZZZ|tara:strand:+ start:6673 stop:6912 length:240 start_codon:yes stop_codon:yes gene_type:complete